VDVTRHVIIRGRVQGVGYRAWTADMAADLDPHGWVRNRLDGTVEALISGEAAAVAAMIEACRCGPPAAQVREVVVSDADDDGSVGFSARVTA
jgi:acylphosphatase